MYKYKEILRKELKDIHIEKMNCVGFDSSKKKAIDYINSLTVSQLRAELKVFKEADREMKREEKMFHM